MLRLVILGDVHYSTGGPVNCDMAIEHAPAIFHAALAQVAGLAQPPDLVIQMGDLVDGTGQT
ncbi:MAG: metallophosphoesterase, partial [Candidatus Sumerlaeia bacterium]|nr:metallophosphoesterase [Candidatus Sumerlaeia bacterium]